MRRLPFHPFVAAAVGGLIMLSLPAHGQPATAKVAPGNAEAVAACERAARQALAPTRQVEVAFSAAPTVDASLSNDSQVVLRGAGRWRDAGDARTFNYSCTVDLRTAEALGLVLRDTTPPSAVTAPARAAIEPDLSHLSPAACESSAAAALKQRWPRVSQINFDSGTRSLQQDSPGRAELHGQGRALPEPDAPATHFGFECEIDPRDGRVLSTRVSG